MFNEKILCLGGNNLNTDIRVSTLASANNTVNHGLLTEASKKIQELGYYHTSPSDLSTGNIISLAKYFDMIILLDQPAKVWSHPTLL